MNNSFFFGSIIAVCVGVGIRSLIPLWHIPWWILLMLCGVLALVAFGVRYHRNALLVCVLLVCIALGMLRFQGVVLEGDPVLDRQVGQRVELTGTVVSDPQVGERTTSFTLKPDTASTRVRVSVSGPGSMEYGDRVRVSGTLDTPDVFVTETGREFNYVAYLSKDKIFHTISFADSTVVDSGYGNPLVRWLLGIKSGLVRSMNRQLPQPESALLAGIVLGEQSSLGDDLEQDFRRTGLIHIVVLSGYNVTIVAYFIMWILGLVITPRKALLVSIIGIGLFMLLVGAGPTVVRASIMATLVIIAQGTGRQYHMVRALFLAGLIMVMINPLMLMFDISFQLSFVATLGLIWVSPWLEQYIPWIPKRFGLRETFGATVGTQIMVLPLLMFYIGEVSLISVPVNLLIIPLIPFMMLIGFAMAVVGLISPVLALPLAWGTYMTHHIVIAVVEWFAAFPFATMQVPQVPAWVLIIVYAPMIYVFAKISSTTDQFTLAK